MKTKTWFSSTQWQKARINVPRSVHDANKVYEDSNLHNDYRRWTVTRLKLITKSVVVVIKVVVVVAANEYLMARYSLFLIIWFIFHGLFCMRLCFLLFFFLPIRLYCCKNFGILLENHMNIFVDLFYDAECISSVQQFLVLWNFAKCAFWIWLHVTNELLAELQSPSVSRGLVNPSPFCFLRYCKVL